MEHFKYNKIKLSWYSIFFTVICFLSSPLLLPACLISSASILRSYFSDTKNLFSFLLVQMPLCASVLSTNRLLFVYKRLIKWKKDKIFPYSMFFVWRVALKVIMDLDLCRGKAGKCGLINIEQTKSCLKLQIGRGKTEKKDEWL